MGIMGNVENGWFANLAHAVESAGRGTLNAVSFGHGWGDRFYDGMHETAQAQVDSMNQGYIQQGLQEAASRGATGSAAQIQALQAANGKLDAIADPKGAADMGELLKAGGSIATDSVKESGAKLLEAMKEWMTPDIMPLLIGGGVLAGAYAVASVAGAPAKPVRRRQAYYA